MGKIFSTVLHLLIFVGYVNLSVGETPLVNTSTGAIVPTPSSCFRSPTSVSVNLEQQGMMLCQQQCTEWCWATVLQATIQFIQPNRGTGSCVLNECGLASNLYFQRTRQYANCCYFGCMATGCNQPAQMYELQTIMSEMGIHSKVLKRALTEMELVNELSQNRPVIMGVRGSQSGHALLIYGYIFDHTSIDGLKATFSVSDPFPQSMGGLGTRTQWTYLDLFNYEGNQFWTDSATFITTDTTCISDLKLQDESHPNGNAYIQPSNIIMSTILMAFWYTLCCLRVCST